MKGTQGSIPRQGTKLDPTGTTNSWHATTKDPTHHKEDGRSRVLQLRPGAAKQINKLKKNYSLPFTGHWPYAKYYSKHFTYLITTTLGSMDKHYIHCTDEETEAECYASRGKELYLSWSLFYHSIILAHSRHQSDELFECLVTKYLIHTICLVDNKILTQYLAQFWHIVYIH